MPERFGQFELLERIGAGGMAEVFKAKTYGPQGFVKEVVIKRILPAFSEDPDFVRMFINEARLAARLQNANIVQIFSFDHVDGDYYIAMELVDGSDLKRILNRAKRRELPIPLSFSVHVGVEALKGLHYAHTRTQDGAPLDLVHRDISPHNLLVSVSGEVKITDFGIAKVAALASATKTGAVKGKLAYMSPEQANSEPLDGRSDIYSLGLVLWELLAGRRAYHGQSEAELFAQVRDAKLPSIESLGVALPSGLSEVVSKMTAKDRERRYASAAEALNAISQYARVGNALEAAAYVCQLLPEHALREQAGNTVSLAQPGTPNSPLTVAGPQDRTRTQMAREGDHSSVPPAASAPAIDGTPSAERSPTGRTGEWSARREERFLPSTTGITPLSAPVFNDLPGGDHSVRGDDARTKLSIRRRRVFLMLASAVLALTTAGVGWGVTRWLTTPAVTWQHARAEAAAEVRLTSDPAGADVTVSTIPVGQAPVIVSGPKGEMLRVAGRSSDGREYSSDVALGGQEGVQLALRGVAKTLSPRERGPSPKLGDSADRRAVVVDDGDHARSASEEPHAKPKPAALGRKGHGGSARHAHPIRHGDSVAEDQREPETAVSASESKESPASGPRDRSASRRKPKAMGYLSVSSEPWAYVYVNGKQISEHETPLKKQPLPVGKYKVELRNQELGAMYREEVTIEAEKVTPVRFRRR